jgi:predicted Zn-ribbon and HTH transcriptional regulator
MVAENGGEAQACRDVAATNHRSVDRRCQDRTGTFAVRTGVREKDVYRHLAHIQKTVAARGKRLVIQPSSALLAGLRSPTGVVLQSRVGAHVAEKRGLSLRYFR